MGYLDYINKKHSRERRIQIIRNKVSGFVLLTIVFMLIFGLTLVMTFFLARAFTKMLKKASPGSSIISDNELEYGGFVINVTNSPYGQQGDQVVPSILMSETMVTASPKPNRANFTHDHQAIDLITKTMRQTLRDTIKKTNITRHGLEKLSPFLTKVLNSTITENIRVLTKATTVDGVVNEERIEEEEDTDEHYIELIDELN